MLNPRPTRNSHPMGLRLEVVYPGFDYETPPKGDPEMKSYRLEV